MILATRFTFIVERILKKTCIFTQKWLDHLIVLLMTSYLVNIATAITELVSKCAQGMNEQLLKTSGADMMFYPLGKKTQKNLMEVCVRG